MVRYELWLLSAAVLDDLFPGFYQILGIYCTLPILSISLLQNENHGCISTIQFKYR